MDPCDIINVCCFFGGEFLRVGSVLKFIGGDEAREKPQKERRWRSA